MFCAECLTCLCSGNATEVRHNLWKTTSSGIMSGTQRNTRLHRFYNLFSFPLIAVWNRGVRVLYHLTRKVDQHSHTYLQSNSSQIFPQCHSVIVGPQDLHLFQFQCSLVKSQPLCDRDLWINGKRWHAHSEELQPQDSIIITEHRIIARRQDFLSSMFLQFFLKEGPIGFDCVAMQVLRLTNVEQSVISVIVAKATCFPLNCSSSLRYFQARSSGPLSPCRLPTNINLKPSSWNADSF